MSTCGQCHYQSCPLVWGKAWRAVWLLLSLWGLSAWERCCFFYCCCFETQLSFILFLPWKLINKGKYDFLMASIFRCTSLPNYLREQTAIWNKEKGGGKASIGSSGQYKSGKRCSLMSLSDISYAFLCKKECVHYTFFFFLENWAKSNCSLCFGYPSCSLL